MMKAREKRKSMSNPKYLGYEKHSDFKNKQILKTMIFIEKPLAKQDMMSIFDNK